MDSIRTAPTPSRLAARAMRRAARRLERPRAGTVLPRRLVAASNDLILGAFGIIVPDATLAAAAAHADLRARVQANLDRRIARIYWRAILAALLRGDITPAQDVPKRRPARLRYLGLPSPLFPAGAPCERSGDELALLWRREQHLLSRKLRAAVLVAARATGFNLLAGPDPADWYVRVNGEPAFVGSDGCAYSAAAAEELFHDARPWTRAELLAQWETHSRTIPIAREFFSRITALVGPIGLGGMEIPPATRVELDRAEAQAPLLVQWICARLGIDVPEARPEIRPLMWRERVASGHGAALLGAHDESTAVYLGPGFTRETLVHELVHWTLTATGERNRRQLRHDDEEALASRLMREATRRG